MKINFKKPKYILPFIVLPFLYLFNYMFVEFFPEKKEENTELEKKAEFNTSIPDPDTENLKIENKFNNLKTNFKDLNDLSGIDDVIVENEVNDNVLESVYSADQANEILKIKDSLERLKLNTKKVMNNDWKFSNQDTKPKHNDEYTSYLKQKKKLEKKLSPQEQFKKEMRIVDSIINPDKYTKKPVLKKQDIKARPIKKIYTIKKATAENQEHFNTGGGTKQGSHIFGLIDEKIKVYAGSRVRIKLGSDITIAGLSLKKNSYLFAVVNGFKAQRIELTITNILLGDQIYNVDLSVYDLDGMKGLYVPASKFREFTKNLGSEASNNAGSSIGSDTQGQNVALTLVTEVAKSTTKAVGNLIKKNKAFLKYNTKIYLINNKIK